MLGLYHKIHTERSELNDKLFTKSSMCAVSHGLEKVIIDNDLPAEVFVTFQKFKFFKEEKEKYLKLDKICKQVFVFCQDIEKEYIKKFNNTTFIELDEDDSLVQEWDLVINTPEHPMLLATYEKPEFQKADIDDYRTFLGFLSFSPEIVETGVQFMIKKLKSYDINYTSQYNSSYKDDLTDFLDNKVSVFLNKSLEELEVKTRELYNNNLLLAKSLKENQDRTLEMVKRLCYAAEYRDEDTATHLVRMSFYSTFLYAKLIEDEKKINQMQYASLMHDIGKVGISDSILLKPGKLTESEFEKIKQHPVIGKNILKGSSHELIQMAEKIAHYHHEKWNGKGYPTGRSGADIPLEARVVAIADVFDALTSDRVYKDAYSIEKAVEIIKEERNEHFDGKIVDIFLDNLNKIIEFKSALESEIIDYPENEIVDHYLDHLDETNFADFQGV